MAFYPITKAYDDGSESHQSFGLGFGLDSKLMDAFNNAYTADVHNPPVSPADTQDETLRCIKTGGINRI